MSVIGHLVRWVRQNPLKISGIAWLIGEGFSALAGDLDLHNPVMVAAATFGAISCFIVVVWGRGGEPDTAHPDAKAVKVLRALDIFSIRKCLLGWRYPVEAAAFWAFFNGLAYAISGIQQWHHSGQMGLAESTLMGAGVLFVIGSIYANCVPERLGHWKPMVKSALYYIAGDILLGLTAVVTHSILLGVAMGIFIASCVAWGFSHRHENKAG